MVVDAVDGGVEVPDGISDGDTSNPRVSFAGKSSMVRSWADSQNYSSP